MSLVKFRARNHPQQRASDEIDDRATTLDVFQPFEREYQLTLDVAASAANTKCLRYFDRSIDGLSQSWAGEGIWCNPPYSAIRPWVEKAWRECSEARAIVMLLPANRTEQDWWQDLIEPYRHSDLPRFHVRFLRGRLRFLARGAEKIGPNERPPFGCCVAIWNMGGPEYRPAVPEPFDLAGGQGEEQSD